MNWFEQLEQKRKLLIGGVILICLAMLVLTVRRHNISYDSFWHIKMGLDWLENDLSLWRDHFSFTFSGHEISGPPYMFQIVLAWLVSQFGLNPGLEIFKLGSFLLAFSLATLFLRQLRSPVVIYLLVLPLIIVMLQLRSAVRPELISYSLSILAMFLYYKADNRISTANMLGITALMFVWSNYHTSIFGYIIFFGFFVDLALSQFRRQKHGYFWLAWLLWGLAVVAIGFLKPGFSHPIIGALTFAPEWKNLILEYKSALQYQNVPAIYSLIIISLITLVLLVRKRQFGLLFVCCLLIYYSIGMIRLVAPSGIVILCAFAWAVSELDLQRILQNKSRTMRQLVGVSIFLVFIVSLASSVYVARSFMQENRLASLFPEDVANHMVNNDINGRIFNTYGTGGYLIYRLSPSSQVYIDGRTGILYPLDHFYNYLNNLRSAKELKADIQEYDINLAVLKNESRYFTLVHDTGLLTLDYVGSRYSLFRKSDANFPVLGALLASPACWNAKMTKSLGDEANTAQQILPPNSYLQPSRIDFMLGFSKATDKPKFLTSLQVDEQWSIDKLRFAAYQSLSNDLDALAREFFSKIPEKEFSDFLGMALAQTRLGEWGKAEQTLDNVTRKIVSFRPFEFKILHDLLVTIGEKYTLKLFDDAYIEGLVKEDTPVEERVLTKLPVVGDFCPTAHALP